MWFVVRSGREEALAVAERGVKFLARKGIEAETLSQTPLPPEGPDLVVTVGGDGTLLHVASALYPQEVPLFPVLLGGVGFLSACRAEELEEGLAAILAGRAKIERRSRLLAQGPGFSTTALNECALVGTAQSRFIQVRVHSENEEICRFGGDGLVVATPTGSTAYALAAGGPVLSPHVPALLLVPLCPHRLGLRPVVFPDNITLEVEAEQASLVLADGDPVGVVSAGEKLRVGRAPKHTLLVRLPQTPSLFARLREKLGWP